MRYRLPFALIAVNWSQLPATRQITLVPKVRTQRVALRDALYAFPVPI